jgi:N-acetylglucosamine kinase-like BadF-type ATPase
VNDQKRYVIGVDGGGSKTHVLLVGLDGSVVSESSGGHTNLQVVGITQAARTLIELILELCKKENCLPESLQNVVLGLSGAGRASDKTALLDALHKMSTKKKFPLKNIVVETDARIALEAAFAGESGIVVIAGTGSIALYCTEDGKILRAGGWGKILGDEGSGYAIAKSALNAVLRQFDSRGEKTILTKKMLEHYSLSAVEELIPKVYQEGADLPSFTPKVFEAAFERDRIANSILIESANELATLVRVLVMQVRPKKKLPVALMGGLIETENIYSKLVKEKIIRSLPHIVVQKPKFPAAFGAAIIGLNAFR